MFEKIFFYDFFLKKFCYFQKEIEAFNKLNFTIIYQKCSSIIFPLSPQANKKMIKLFHSPSCSEKQQVTLTSTCTPPHSNDLVPLSDITNLNISREIFSLSSPHEYDKSHAMLNRLMLHVSIVISIRCVLKAIICNIVIRLGR